jgi:uncharacterized protein DUF3306
MPDDDETPEGFTLKRWSRRKLEMAREARPATTAPPRAPDHARDESLPIAASPPVAGPGPTAEPVLPPVESLTLDSDFTVFLKPKVDESLKRQALKKLFADPHFNVMDGLDVYIDDYTKSDPIPPDVLERLMKAQFSWSPTAVDDDSTKTPASIQTADAPVAEPVEQALLPEPEGSQDASPASDAEDPAQSR